MAASVPRKSVLETLVLSLIAVMAVSWIVIASMGWGVLRGSIFGWNLGFDGTTISYVTPGAPAAKAGIVAGDRVDWASLPLLGRANLAIPQVAPPGSVLTFTLLHGTEKRVVSLSPIRWDEHQQNATRLAFIAQMILIAIGIVLVRLRPSRMTWGFLLAWILWAPTIRAENDPAKFLLINGFAALLNGISIAGLFTFISRFPKERPIGSLAYLDRAAVPFGALVALLWLALDLLLVYSAAPPPEWLLFAVQSVVPPLIAIVVVSALVISYASATSADRQRILPVLASVAFLAVAITMLAVFKFNFTGGISSYVLNDAVAVGQLVLALAVAHGVIRHRVIDLSFAISRTVVYTTLTTLLVGAFALVDFASNKLFEQFGVAILLEALVALGFAVWMNAIHARVDRFVDRVLFGRRHLAEARIRRTARSLVHSDTPSFIDEALVIDASDAFDLASAAVFRANGNGFERTIAQGWGAHDAEGIAHDDHLAVLLRAELAPLDLLSVRWPLAEVPNGLRHPILAIPLVARHELIGFVLYGGHLGGEAIDPDEKATLVDLAQSAASAYEYIRANALLAESTALRSENALLREKEGLLLRMMDSLRTH